MVNNREAVLDLTFHALADRTRRDILKRLADGELSISELAQTYDMSLVAVSKHIKVLEKAGLLASTKEGRVHRCVMRFEPLAAASEQISFYMQFWNQQLEGLDQYVQGVMENKKSQSRRKKNGE